MFLVHTIKYSFITYININFFSHFLGIDADVLQLLKVLNKSCYNQIIKIFKSVHMYIVLLYVHYLCFYRVTPFSCHLLLFNFYIN
jgi:hypothetical protein